MSELQPWLGICHLTKLEGEIRESYQAIAAVFCAEREDYDKLLHQFLEPKGYNLLWSEEVHPAGQWAARHPVERNAAEMARTVHADHTVEIGNLKAVSKNVEKPEEEQPYLIIQEIKDVEPLDLQFGAVERKSVPDALYDPFFGQVEPTEAEIAYYGSVEAVPPMKIYAILDAAKVQFLTSYLERSELYYKCLFKGSSAEELKDVAPYIVELTDDNEFTRNLFTSAGMPSNMWDKEAGIYIRSRATLDELWRHFRKFTRIQNDSGKWFYFAFWEPRHLTSALSGFTPEQLYLFLNRDLISEILTFTTHESRKVRLRHDEHSVPDAKFILTSEIMAELGKSVEREFYRKLQEDGAKHVGYRDDLFKEILRSIAQFRFSSRKTIRELTFWSLDEGRNTLAQKWAMPELEESRGMPDEIRLDRLKNISRKVLEHG